MKISIESEPVVKITLTVKEAATLGFMLQNPSTENEPEDIQELRRQLFDAIQAKMLTLS